jgi:hypothetical protein
MAYDDYDRDNPPAELPAVVRRAAVAEVLIQRCSP